ncbi:hypothetical protein KC325_g44 [Hortaea werneckii]|nr:hypothetical protein KC325_g44 [Hortaea werneckii]
MLQLPEIGVLCPFAVERLLSWRREGLTRLVRRFASEVFGSRGRGDGALAGRLMGMCLGLGLPPGVTSRQLKVASSRVGSVRRNAVPAALSNSNATHSDQRLRLHAYSTPAVTLMHSMPLDLGRNSSSDAVNGLGKDVRAFSGSYVGSTSTGCVACFERKGGGPVSKGKLTMNGRVEVEGMRVQNLSPGTSGLTGCAMLAGGGCLVSSSSVTRDRKIALRPPPVASSNPTRSTDTAPMPRVLLRLRRSLWSTVTFTVPSTLPPPTNTGAVACNSSFSQGFVTAFCVQRLMRSDLGEGQLASLGTDCARDSTDVEYARKMRNVVNAALSRCKEPSRDALRRRRLLPREYLAATSMRLGSVISLISDRGLVLPVVGGIAGPSIEEESARYGLF